MAKVKSSESSNKSTAGSGEGSGEESLENTTFEKALGELETLVESMESDQAPLDELIENYEKGTRLYDLCQQRLDNAQRRVDLIRDGAGSGDKSLEPFDEKSESLERNKETQENTNTDDGQLF